MTTSNASTVQDKSRNPTTATQLTPVRGVEVRASDDVCKNITKRAKMQNKSIHGGINNTSLTARPHPLWPNLGQRFSLKFS